MIRTRSFIIINPTSTKRADQEELRYSDSGQLNIFKLCCSPISHYTLRQRKPSPKNLQSSGNHFFQKQQQKQQQQQTILTRPPPQPPPRHHLTNLTNHHHLTQFATIRMQLLTILIAVLPFTYANPLSARDPIYSPEVSNCTRLCGKKPCIDTKVPGKR